MDIDWTCGVDHQTPIFPSPIRPLVKLVQSIFHCRPASARSHIHFSKRQRLLSHRLASYRHTDVDLNGNIYVLSFRMALHAIYNFYVKKQEGGRDIV